MHTGKQIDHRWGPWQPSVASAGVMWRECLDQDCSVSQRTGKLAPTQTRH